MNAVELLQVIRALSSLVELASSVGVDVKRLAEMKKKAKEENRDLSDEELLSLSNSAQESIDAAKEV